MSKDNLTYLTSDDIYEEWKKYKETGVVSEKMGEQMLTLARHVMEHRKFVRYSQEMKDEMVQDGVLKILKNIHNMKSEFRKSFFNYWTRCVFTAAVVYLAKHYKRVNLKRQLYLDALVQAHNNIAQNDPKTIELISELERQIREYGTYDQMDIDPETID